MLCGLWHITTSGSYPPCWNVWRCLCTLLYTPLRRITFKALSYDICQRYVRDSKPFTFQRQNPFSHLQKLTTLAKNWKYRQNDALTCLRSPSYSVTISRKNNCHIPVTTWWYFFKNHNASKLLSSHPVACVRVIVESICDPKWQNPKKIPSKGFIVLSESAGRSEFEKKSP